MQRKFWWNTRRPSGSRTARLPARALCFTAVRVGDRLLHCRSIALYTNVVANASQSRARFRQRRNEGEPRLFLCPDVALRSAVPRRNSFLSRKNINEHMSERASAGLLSRKEFCAVTHLFSLLVNPIIRERCNLHTTVSKKAALLHSCTIHRNY